MLTFLLYLYLPSPADTLFAIFLVMAFMGVLITILHNRAARNLELTYEPGTIAAAVALAGLSDIAHILDGKDTLDDMHAMLTDLQFAIDPVCFNQPLLILLSAGLS